MEGVGAGTVVPGERGYWAAVGDASPGDPCPRLHVPRHSLTQMIHPLPKTFIFRIEITILRFHQVMNNQLRLMFVKSKELIVYIKLSFSSLHETSKLLSKFLIYNYVF